MFGFGGPVTAVDNQRWQAEQFSAKDSSLGNVFGDSLIHT